MKELFLMWGHTRMVILTALSAAIFAAVLIPFKGGIPIVPGITEVRPANVFPPVFGLLFGPAGAWGAAIGNTIGDMLGGTLSWGTVAGFFGNFFLGFIPYKMWGVLVPRADVAPTVNSGRKVAAYVAVSIVSAAACGVIIAWYLDLVGLVPFAFLSIVLTLNNSIAELVLGPPLLLLLYPRVRKWGLLWTDIMDRAEVARGFLRGAGAALAVAGAIGGLIAGIGISTGLYGQRLFAFGTGTSGSMGVGLAVLPFIGLIVLGGFMLSGRELFREDG